MQNITELNSIAIEKMFSLSSLQNIADNISSLIKFDIVIANRNGVIIAASRKSRIGIFNANVKEMIETNAEMHVVYSEVTGGGFLPGINLPIRYEGNSIASVGITGEPSEVKVFGKIIQSFVQQQLTDMAHEKEKANRRQILNNFVYDWIFKTSYSDEEAFELHASSLGINVHAPRMLCIMRVASITPGSSSDSLHIQLQQFIASWLTSIDRQHIVALLGNEIVVLLNTSNSTISENLMTQIRDIILKNYNVQMVVGIGMSFLEQDKARLSYEAAKLACKASEEANNRAVYVFDFFDFRLLISSISKPIKQQVFNSVYRNFASEKQIQESIVLLKSYVEHNRSINQTASELFLHKNTVQAHLNRIYELSGYNPRDTKDLTLLYATTHMYEMGIRVDQDA